MREIIVVGIVGILLLAASSSLSAEEQKGETAGYSGGYIQSLIDAANPGDTIYIPSGIYYEHIEIYKPITLIGEDKETTIIDGSGSGNVVYTRKADTETVITITGFTIRNGNIGVQADYTGKLHIIGNKIIENKEDGIEFYASCYCIVEKNIISNNLHSGIFDWAGSTRATYKDNILISNGMDGIFLSSGTDSIVTENTVESNGRHGIRVQWTEYNTVSYNTVKSNNQYGIHLFDADYNQVYRNKILNNLECGVYVDDYPYGCDLNEIYHNNFIGNKINAYDAMDILPSNIWYSLNLLEGNYWDDYKEKYPDAKPLPLRPKIWDTPYEIPGPSGRLDRFPLVNKYTNNQNIQSSQSSSSSSSSSSSGSSSSSSQSQTIPVGQQYQNQQSIPLSLPISGGLSNNN